MAEPAGDALANAQPNGPASREPLPWYRDLRFAIGFLAAPFFFFASNIVTFVVPGLTQGAAGHQLRLSGADDLHACLRERRGRLGEPRAHRAGLDCR